MGEGGAPADGAAAWSASPPLWPPRPGVAAAVFATRLPTLAPAGGATLPPPPLPPPQIPTPALPPLVDALLPPPGTGTVDAPHVGAGPPLRSARPAAPTGRDGAPAWAANGADGGRGVCEAGPAGSWARRGVVGVPGLLRRGVVAAGAAGWAAAALGGDGMAACVFRTRAENDPPARAPGGGVGPRTATPVLPATLQLTVLPVPEPAVVLPLLPPQAEAPQAPLALLTCVEHEALEAPAPPQRRELRRTLPARGGPLGHTGCKPASGLVVRVPTSDEPLLHWLMPDSLPVAVAGSRRTGCGGRAVVGAIGVHCASHGFRAAGEAPRTTDLLDVESRLANEQVSPLPLRTALATGSKGGDGAASGASGVAAAGEAALPFAPRVEPSREARTLSREADESARRRGVLWRSPPGGGVGPGLSRDADNGLSCCRLHGVLAVYAPCAMAAPVLWLCHAPATRAPFRQTRRRLA